MKRTLRPRPIRLVLALLALLAALSSVSTALAHPLGNFTINHYARLEPSANGLRVRYVLDFAEIPTFQEKQAMDKDSDGKISDAERLADLQTRLPQWQSQLFLTVDGKSLPLALEPGSATLEFLRGQGGLEIMRLGAWFTAPLAVGASGTKIEFRDENYKERLGWREIVVRPANGLAVNGTNFLTQDRTNELTVYPEDMLSSPLDQRDATLNVVLAAAGATNGVSNPITTGALGAFDRTRDEFSALINTQEELSLSVILFSFLAAIVLGGLHSFSPGHGKAIVGAYLVGSRGTAWHAVFLGLVVTATHTAGVYALGFITLFLSAYILPEQLYPWLGFISGMLVALIGIRLLISRWNASRNGLMPQQELQRELNASARRTGLVPEPAMVAAVAGSYASPALFAPANGHDHDHDHDHAHDHVHPHEHSHGQANDHDHPHDHDHAHDHDHDHDAGHQHDHVHTTTHAARRGGTHSHDFKTKEEELEHARSHLTAVEVAEKPTMKNLVSLGISGGLLPCPSALVVMLSAIALGRVAYGLFLIVGFSFGLAGVLVLTGLALLYAGRYAGKFMGGAKVGFALKYIPIAGAGVVAVLGIGIALEALMQTGLIK